MDKGSVKSIYKFVERIGQGTFGLVFKGLDRKTGERVAIKVMKKKKMNENDMNDLQSEIEIM